MKDENKEETDRFFDPFRKEEFDDNIIDALLRLAKPMVDKSHEAAYGNPTDLTDQDVVAMRTLLKVFNKSFPRIDKILGAGQCKEILKNEKGVFAILSGILILFEKVSWSFMNTAADDLEFHRLKAMIDQLKTQATKVGKAVYTYDESILAHKTA